jgi:hypothetical protein
MSELTAATAPFPFAKVNMSTVSEVSVVLLSHDIKAIHGVLADSH